MPVSDIVGDPALWARRLTWATVAGLALGLAGPFGSYLSGEVLDRLAYWTGLCWVGALLLGLTLNPAVKFAHRIGAPRRFALAVATLAACAPLAALAAGVGRRVWPEATAGMEPLHWYAQTLFIAAPLIAAMVWVESRGEGRRPVTASSDGERAPAITPPASAGPSEADLLPPRLRARALCLQMEDHYVRVHTATGSELVLMPMRRAVEALEVEGLQVHRSWWVARASVTEVTGEGRSLALLLNSGLRVPVARSRVAELRAKGWLDQGEPTEPLTCAPPGTD